MKIESFGAASDAPRVTPAFSSDVSGAEKAGFFLQVNRKG